MALRMRAATAALALAALAGSASAAIRINEVRADNPSADINEYFELAGLPGESLANHWYIVIGDGTGGSGVVEAVIPLSGSIPTDGYFLAAEDTHTIDPGEIDLSLSGAGNGLNFENDDQYTHLLITGWTGALNADLDTNDDGVLDSTPWASVVDSVAFVGEGSDRVYSSTQIGPDPIKLTPWHLYRFPNGTGGWLFDSIDVAANNDPSNYTSDTPGTRNLPSPGAMALLGMGGLLAARRRR